MHLHLDQRCFSYCILGHGTFGKWYESGVISLASSFVKFHKFCDSSIRDHS